MAKYWRADAEQAAKAYQMFGIALICTCVGIPFGAALIAYARNRLAEHRAWEALNAGQTDVHH